MIYQELQQHYQHLYNEATTWNTQYAFSCILSALKLRYVNAIKEMQTSHDLTSDPERKMIYAEFLKVAQDVTDQS